MQRIGNILEQLERNNPHAVNLQQTWQDILNYPPIHDFIQAHQAELSQEMIENSRSKLNEFKREHEAKERGEEGQNPGFTPELILNGNYIDVTYVPTETYYRWKAEQVRHNLLDNRMMSRDVRQATLRDFYVNTPQRQYLLKQSMDFLHAYEKEPYATQALYIHGSFGVGKTYLLGALANYLVDRLEKHVTMIHYPTFTSQIKNAIQSGTVQQTIDEIRKVDVLMIDDIGAEANTAWVRDEVLNNILEYRMKESLATFFTSNFSMEILETHLAKTKDSIDTGKAMRIMERIRYLAREVEFNGENLRQAKRQGN